MSGCGRPTRSSVSSRRRISKSVWCAAEIGAARALGSRAVAGARFSGRRRSTVDAAQFVDVARDPSDARERLRSRLSVIDGGGGRGWADDQSPYPGLRPFDLGEHRVFFGRAREITQIAERLRSPAERAAPGNSHRGGTFRVRKVVVDSRRGFSPHRR